MLRPFTKITIQQIPTDKWKNRNLLVELDFVNSYEVTSNWENHTNNATIAFPKNIALLKTSEGLFAKSGTYNVILGGSGAANSPNTNTSRDNITIAPLIMKGDLVTINHGLIFRNENDKEVQCSTGGISIPNIPINNELSTTLDLFQGYVSAVKSDIPIKIELEDNFYLLKRTPFPKTVWNKKEAIDEGLIGTSMYDLMKYILSLVNNAFYYQNDKYPKLELLDIPDSITAQFSLGYLDIGDMTCAELLGKLKQQYHMESTFRGNTLQFGFPIYTDSETYTDGTPKKSTAVPKLLKANSTRFFLFRDIYNSSNKLQASANIFPLHDLEYMNKDDVRLSAIVQCKVINSVPGKSTLSGAQKTKVSKLKVLVFWDIVTSSFKYWDLSKPGTKNPEEKDGGERHQFYYPVDNTNPNPTIDDLVRYGTAHLKKYHYTGFKGCFTSFSFPYVQWNDNANILDPIMSDRNGQYKIKMVKYKGGIKGQSSEIHLDYKIDIPLPTKVLSIYLL